MHSRHAHDLEVPRLPLAAMGALLLLTLAAVVGHRWLSDGASTATPSAPVVAERRLRFDDRPDGGIQVRDAASGATVREIAPGADPFLRGALRALVRERRSQGLGPDQAFHLVARADGRLSLLDPGTARRLDLESFGTAQARVFAGLLDAPAR